MLFPIIRNITKLLWRVDLINSWKWRWRVEWKIIRKNNRQEWGILSFLFFSDSACLLFDYIWWNHSHFNRLDDVTTVMGDDDGDDVDEADDNNSIIMLTIFYGRKWNQRRKYIFVEICCGKLFPDAFQFTWRDENAKSEYEGEKQNWVNARKLFAKLMIILIILFIFYHNSHHDPLIPWVRDSRDAGWKKTYHKTININTHRRLCCCCSFIRPLTLSSKSPPPPSLKPPTPNVKFKM